MSGSFNGCIMQLWPVRYLIFLGQADWIVVYIITSRDLVCASLLSLSQIAPPDNLMFSAILESAAKYHISAVLTASQMVLICGGLSPCASLQPKSRSADSTASHILFCGDLSPSAFLQPKSRSADSTASHTLFCGGLSPSILLQPKSRSADLAASHILLCGSLSPYVFHVPKFSSADLNRPST
jgi:hypothetical protein